MEKHTRIPSSLFIDIIRMELQQHNISVIHWSDGAYGSALCKERKVIIPYPTTILKLGICFHEIGHVVLKHYRNLKSYIKEYEAEIYAINKLKEYGLYKKFYEVGAISYVMSKIAHAYNRKHNLNDIPQEIVKWTNIKTSLWNKYNKIVVSVNYEYKHKKDIIIQYL